jgi:hypothetical protein
MSGRELERVEVMGRVDSGALKLKDAAAMLELSPGEEIVAALSGGGRQGAAAWERGPALQSE